MWTIKSLCRSWAKPWIKLSLRTVVGTAEHTGAVYPQASSSEPLFCILLERNIVLDWYEPGYVLRQMPLINLHRTKKEKQSNLAPVHRPLKNPGKSEPSCALGFWRKGVERDDFLLKKRLIGSGSAATALSGSASTKKTCVTTSMKLWELRWQLQILLLH